MSALYTIKRLSTIINAQSVTMHTLTGGMMPKGLSVHMLHNLLSELFHSCSAISQLISIHTECQLTSSFLLHRGQHMVL